MTSKIKKSLMLRSTSYTLKKKLYWSTQSTSSSYSTFVVWRDIFSDRNNRIVIDIREFNEIIEFDSYWLSLYSEIIFVVIDYVYVFIINAIDWFYQFNIRRSDRWKFMIINHRDLKKFDVILMRYKDSSSYVQRQINKLLRSYKLFARTYVDDIIVFSLSLEKYLYYLRVIFQLFRDKRVNQTLTKLILNLLSITLIN